MFYCAELKMLTVAVKLAVAFYDSWDWFLCSLYDTEGGGGKGTWGKLLDTDGESRIDRNDPNYDSGEVLFFYDNTSCIFHLVF